jgi:dipeptidyl aminopeptidase/acylaminoacyl peptidase
MVAAAAVALGCGPLAASTESAALTIPRTVSGPKRHITTDDLARLRDIGSFSISPDGERFAILVRQAVPEKNSYRTAWFVGSLRTGELLPAGDGGELRLLFHSTGESTGDFGGSVSRWSPDGRFIAYTVLRDGEVQLFTSSTDGSAAQRQLTRNPSDVRDFSWSDDGRSVLFKVGTPRSELARRAEAKAWSGYRLQEFNFLFRAVSDTAPAIPLETNMTAWRVGLDGTGERPANEAEQAALAAADKRQAGFLAGGVEIDVDRLSAVGRPPVVRADGAVAWLERADPKQDGPMPQTRLRVQMKEGAKPIVCEHSQCAGQMFNKLWWSVDGKEVVFWQYDGPTQKSHSMYAWSPTKNSLRTLVSSPEHVLDSCELVQRRVVCLRETPLQPRHVAAFDVKTGAVSRIADVNPEMALYHLGRVEHIEWDTGPRATSFSYAPRAHGFILYPPDYDARKKYPVFIAPYDAGGFIHGDVGHEHPLLVYAANGFIVINSTFPGLVRHLVSKDYVQLMRRIYDAAEGYPHLAIFADSTLAGLDVAMSRASIDPQRVGSGGVSHGAFVPLFMMQRSERIAALSVAGGSWNRLEYYFASLADPYAEPQSGMWPEDPAYWEPIDIAYNLDKVEAPVLFHIPDSEMIGSGVLVRRMSDARLPYEAYVFPDELHLKWQSAHRLAVYNRNVDWFRFWLQDIEDPEPAKAEQYERWRKLRQLQCENKRSLRDYCNVTATSAAPAR